MFSRAWLDYELSVNFERARKLPPVSLALGDRLHLFASRSDRLGAYLYPL